MNDDSQKHAPNLYEQMLMRKLAATPSSRLLATPSLPSITAPSLSGLTLTTSQIQSPTGPDLVARYVDLCLAAAPRREREADELLEEGDEVLIDVVAYHAGKIVPRSVQEGLRVRLTPGAFMEGFSAAMVGHNAHAKTSFRLTVPADHSFVSLQGQVISLAVEVRKCFEVQELDLESPQTLALLNRGGTIREVMDAIAKELIEERLLEQRFALADQALHLLIARASVSVSDALVDVEIGKRWRATEGKFLEKVKAPTQECEAALGVWLDDAALRKELRTRLSAQQVILALAEAHRKEIGFTKATAEAYAAELAQAGGFSVSDLKAAGKAEPLVAHTFAMAGITFPVLDFILSKADLQPAN